MTNRIKAGDSITFITPVDVANRELVQQGDLLGIANHAAKAGQAVSLLREGVFKMPKIAGQTFAVGAPVYFDKVAKAYTSFGAGNTWVGGAIVAAEAGDAHVQFLLQQMAGFAGIKTDAVTGVSIFSDSGQAALAGTGVMRNSAEAVQSVPSADLYISVINNNGMELPNPYAAIGKANAPVHPGPMAFDTTWNGYKYWLAYTPYPGVDSTYENPCMAASNDLKTWTAMGRLPLVDKPANGYNADTHIFMSPDGKTMYLAFRERLTITAKNNLLLMHTTDGISWSSPVAIMTGNIGTQDFASPSLWWNGTGWTCIAHNLDGTTPYPVQRFTSTTADVYGAWSAPAAVSLAPFTGRQWWHSYHFRMPSGQILGLIQDNLASGQPGFVYWVESADDGVSYTLTGHAMAGVGIRGYRSAFTVEPTPNGPIINLFLGDLNAPKVLRNIARTGYQRIKSEYQARHAAYLSQGATLSPECQWADSFNRADSASVVGTASSGGTYTVASGTWGIRSNQAYAVASGKLLAAGTEPNHEVQARLSGVTSGVQQWIIGRSLDSNNYWRIGTYGGAYGLSTLVLQSVVAGGISVNKEVGVMMQGDIVALRCSGVTIEVLVNGVVQHTEISSVNQAGTGYGLQCNSGGANSNYDSLVCLKV